MQKKVAHDFRYVPRIIPFTVTSLSVILSCLCVCRWPEEHAVFVPSFLWCKLLLNLSAHKPFTEETDEFIMQDFHLSMGQAFEKFPCFLEPECSVHCSQDIAFGPILYWLHEINFFCILILFSCLHPGLARSLCSLLPPRYIHVAKRSIQKWRACLKSQVDFAFVRQGRC